MISGWTEFFVRKIFGYRGERLSQYFDDLELDIVIPQLLSYVHGRVDAQNIIWIRPDDFKQLRSGKNSEIDAAFSTRTIGFWGLNEIKASDVHTNLVGFTGESTLGEINEAGDILVPILQPKTTEVMAYLLVVGVKPTSAKKTLGKIIYDLHYMAKHISFSLQLWQAQQLTLKDDLTDLYNHKYLTIVLQNEISRSQRNNKKFTVLFMDIDYFKSVNDTMGHWVGSRLLVEVGRIIDQNIRKSDFPFRYGGDEFVVLLAETDSQGARVAAERLRQMIEKTDFLIDGQNIKLTLSIGLATFPDHANTHKDIIKMADEAMYCGKNKSRNIVYVAS